MAVSIGSFEDVLLTTRGLILVVLEIADASYTVECRDVFLKHNQPSLPLVVNSRYPKGQPSSPGAKVAVLGHGGGASTSQAVS